MYGGHQLWRAKVFVAWLVLFLVGALVLQRDGFLRKHFAGQFESNTREVKQRNNGMVQSLSWYDSQKQRKSRVKNICKRIEYIMGGKLKKCNHLQMILDDKHHALYCFVPKVGCSTWKSILHTLSSDKANVSGDFVKMHEPNKIQENGMTMLGLVTDPAARRQKLQESQAYKKFAFFRHPLERLVSAYRDKFESNDPLYCRTYGVNILKLYREQLTEQELVQGQGVTFAEFVQYVVDGHDDPHWSTYVDGCCLCHVDYSIIGRMDSFTDDSIHVLRDVFDKNSTEAERLIPKVHINPLGRTNATHVTHYMHQLSTKLIRKVNEHYKWDFLMFEFKPFDV